MDSPVPTPELSESPGPSLKPILESSSLSDGFLSQESDPPISSESHSPLFETTLPSDVLPPDSEDHTPSTSEIGGPANDSDLDSAINALMFNAVVPQPEIRPQIEQILETRRIAAIMAGDYARAEGQDRILRLLQTSIQTAEQKRSEDSSVDQLYARWQKLERLQQEITEKWDAQLRELMAKNDEEQSLLQAQQSQEIEHFIAKWKEPAFLRPFTKPTQKLLQLREQERHMGLSRMYVQANEAKVVADRRSVTRRFGPTPYSNSGFSPFGSLEEDRGARIRSCRENPAKSGRRLRSWHGGEGTGVPPSWQQRYRRESSRR
jgi:hypothetical protein